MFSFRLTLSGSKSARDLHGAVNFLAHSRGPHQLSYELAVPFGSRASSERDHKRRAGPKRNRRFRSSRLALSSRRLARFRESTEMAQRQVFDSWRREGVSSRRNEFSSVDSAGPGAASTAQRDVGLVVFEAPAQSHDLRSVSKDAQDRMRMLERLADSSSCRYNVAILVITCNRRSSPK